MTMNVSRVIAKSKVQNKSVSNEMSGVAQLIEMSVSEMSAHEIIRARNVRSHIAASQHGTTLNFEFEMMLRVSVVFQKCEL